MAKALKIAGAVVAVAGLALVTGGLAAGASLSFIMSAGSGLAGLTVGGLFTASALLNTAGSLLSPKPKAPSTSASNADRLTVSMDLRAFRKIVIGTTAMATDLRDQEWSADQSLLHRFVVCASHRSGAVREIWFDDKLAWTLAGGVQGEYRGYLTVVPVLEGSAANAINIGPRMGGARRFTGLTYVYLRYKLTGNSKKTESPFASSIPSRVTIVGDGALFYDPRLDSTVPGGAGPMRADDQRTWAWNDSACRNPALALLFYLLGWRIQNPVTGEWKLAVGKGIPASRIDLPSFITAANLCDEPVTTAAGVSEPRYRADGIFSEGDDPGLVLDNLKAAMNAVLDDADGKIRVTVLHNDLATPIGDLGAADVLGEFTWLQTPPLTDSINVIRGGYIDPSRTSLFQLVDFPEVAIASPDGIDRPQTVNLALVQSPGQAQRLVRMRLARAQYGGTYTAIFQATAWKYQKGDVIRFSFHPLGWDKKLFRIADVATQVDGTVPMMLREENPAIYAAYSDERAAVLPAAPTSYDPSLWPVLQGIVDAGTTAEWPGITGPGKPADDATNSADPDSPFGPDGTVKEAIATLKRIEPIASDVSALEMAKVEHDDALALLDGVQVDMAAIQRQAERDAGKLDEAMLRLLAESSRTRDVLRDAGIVVDPATGVVRIYAVDQVAERTSRVEVGLDSVRGTVALKADSDWVNGQIALAVLNPEQAAQLEPIIKRLASVEIVADGLLGTINSKANAVDLTATTKRVTTAEQSIDTLTGSITQKVDRTTFDALGETVQSIEQKLDTEGDRTGFSLNIRQARLVADDAATAALRGLLAGDDANRRQILQAAEIRQDIYTRIKDGEMTLAKERLELVAEVDAVRAMTVRETTAIVDALGVAARDIRSLAVTTDKQAGAIGEVSEAVIDAKGGLARNGTTIRQVVGRADTADEALLRAIIAGDDASRVRQAQIVQIQTELSTTLVANEAASATARQSLLARMNQAEAAIVDVQHVLADQIQSLVERVRASEAAWTDKDTGLVATRARLAVEEKLSADRHKANAESIETLSSTVNNPVTGLPAAFATIGRVRETAANENAATAKLVEQVRAELDGVGDVGLEQAFDAVINRLGKIEGRYALTIDANGNLSGFEVIGSDQGRGTFNAINVDFRMGTGRIIFNNGAFMQVQGIGFGVDGTLIEWYGPTMPLGECSTRNAISYKTNDGRSVFRGAVGDASQPLSVSTRVLGANQLSSPAWEKSGTITRVQATFSYNAYGVRPEPGSGPPPEVTLVLYRKMGTAPETEVGRITQIGSSAFEDTRPSAFEQSVSAMITYADTDASTATRVWRVAVALTANGAGGSASRPDEISQSISITATAQ